MKPLDRLSEYLGAVERRLRWVAVTRGVAVTAGAALIFTVLAVLLANSFAFSNGSVVSARVLLFLGLAAAIGAALIVPIIRLNRRRAARETESQYPQFQERLLTFSERLDQNPNDPFLPLLADDTLSVAQQAQPETVAKTSRMAGFSSAAAAATAVLLWLFLAGPGFFGYGTHLLWAGLPKDQAKPFYDIEVQPGNLTIRKKAPQVISARLRGFSAPTVRFLSKYASASKWEQTDMRTEENGSSYTFALAGVPESLEYYIEAGGVRSKTYKLNVIDLPSVKNIQVTYHYPSWTGMKDMVENPGGDLRAVEGTTADLEIKTDRLLNRGTILLDDGSKLELKAGPNNTLLAKVPIQKDGLYHIAAIENGEDIRLTEDYFIEAQKDRAPEVKITRPGRDFRASPIEEVTVAVDAKDDFGLRDVELHYTVNGGEEKTVSLLQSKGAKESSGSSTLSLEDFKVVPGDIVSLYATAKDARTSTSTDIFFVEVQPFERNYSQSQQQGGGGGGGGDQDQTQISERQKQIITATFNELKGSGAKGTEAENAAFLTQVQAKLRDQAKSLSDRMKARQLADSGDAFKSFTNDMDQAVVAMGQAADKLKGANWKDAMGPERTALQFLERAEATRRDIQVAFGNRGGGGGGGGQGGARDLEGLFDLELDTEKNQYESASGGQGGNQQKQEIDDLLQKLQELAKRQQELADQARKNQQVSQQRFQQEMLRRQAEELQRQIDQMRKNQQGMQGQPSQQQGQQGQGQDGQQSQQQQGNPQRASQGNAQGSQGSQSSQQMQQTLERLQRQLEQAQQSMRQAANSQQAGTPQSEAEARKAAEALNEAQRQLAGMVGQQSANTVENLAKQAEDLARQQQEFEGNLRKTFGNNQQNARPTQQQVRDLSESRQKEIDGLKDLEQKMQSAVRDLNSTQHKASAMMRDALGEMQQQELPRDMQRNADYIRRGYPEYAVLSEPGITQGMNALRDRLKEVQQAMGPGQDDKNAKGAGGANDKAVEPP